MQNAVIIQFIGAQVMPNLWPVLAIKPKAVHNLHSKKTEFVADDLEWWLKRNGAAFGVDVRVHSHELSEDRQLEDSSDICKRIIEESSASGDVVIVNYTGGTKLMSGAGLIAAINNRESQTMVVYAETNPIGLKCIHNVKRFHELFGPIDVPQLNVERILQAHGMEITGTRRDWRLYRRAAEIVWRARGISPSDKGNARCFKVEDVKDINTARPILLKPLDELVGGNGAAAFIKTISTADSLSVLTDPALGLFEVWEDGKLHLPHSSVSRCLELLDEYEHPEESVKKAWWPRWHSAVSDVQASLNFLTGGWWEIMTAWYMEKTGAYDEILWSVETRYRKLPEKRMRNKKWESDVIARKGNQLTVVSCKHGSKEINELFAHSERATTLGGSNTVAILSFYKPFEHIVAEKLGIKKLDSSAMLNMLGLSL